MIVGCYRKSSAQEFEEESQSKLIGVSQMRGYAQQHEVQAENYLGTIFSEPLLDRGHSLLLPHAHPRYLYSLPCRFSFIDAKPIQSRISISRSKKKIKCAKPPGYSEGKDFECASTSETFGGEERWMCQTSTDIRKERSLNVLLAPTHLEGRGFLCARTGETSE
jgi:hypothetical protein